MDVLTLDSVDGIPLDAAFHASSGERRGSVVQAHGINADMDEGGMLQRLADELAAYGFDVMRFSFRGHGESGGTQRGATVAGEMLDLQAALEHVGQHADGPLILVVASFGAVSVCLSLPFIHERVEAMALWNPVLDLRGTFVDPRTPWASESFNDEGIRSLYDRGYLMLDGEFEVGRVLYEEMRAYDPYAEFLRYPKPSLIIHGDADRSVSFDVSARAAREHPDCDFVTIPGSDHGFSPRSNEDKAITATVEWVRRRFP